MSKANDVKIQINTVEGLSRLIGDDSQLSIEIKKDVGRQIAQIHFPEAVRAAFLGEFNGKSFKDILKEKFHEEVLHIGGWGSFKISEKVQKRINETVTKEVNLQISNTLDQIVTSKALEVAIKEYEESVIKRFEKAMINTANKYLSEIFIPQVLTPMVSELMKNIQETEPIRSKGIDEVQG